KHKLDRVVLFLNGLEHDRKVLNNTFEAFEFNISPNTFDPNNRVTVVVKGYDEHGEVLDSNIIQIVDCNELPPEEIPDNNGEESLYLAIDNRPTELCINDDLIFYGSAQGPYPIDRFTFRVNGRQIDPNNIEASSINNQTISN